MARSRMVGARDWDEEEQELFNYLMGETDKIWKGREGKHTNLKARGRGSFSNS